MKNLLHNLSIIVFSIIALIILQLPAFGQSKGTIRPFTSYGYFQPNIGLSQYYGDLNKDNLFNKNPKFAFGGILGYQVSPVIGLRAQLLKANLYSERTDQDVKLGSNLIDGALNITVNINELFSEYNNKRYLNFYLFSGIGATSYKSKLESVSAGTVLQENTARQNEVILPLGAGAAIRLSDKLSVNLEYGDHITFKGTGLDFQEGKKRNDHYSYASAGLQIRFGKTDADGDGVKDKDDLCPDVPGKSALAGCPDKDSDGIADKDDDCPETAGKADFKGCPDTDGDGVPDKDDSCPKLTGKKELSGCPDKDEDGIADKDDKCPDMFGKAEFQGCPDRDGDGVTDNVDDCADIKGLKEFAGCPDTDGDGIPDNKDNCPEEAGITSTKGCPEEFKGAVLQKIVYFNTDESVVLAQNIIDLNEISAYMNENPAAVLSVSGHTDARESEEYNLRLSEKRADYVIDYLRKKGMTSKNIDKSFFGKSKPAADNSTVEGRALNRRVEMKITK